MSKGKVLSWMILLFTWNTSYSCPQNDKLQCTCRHDNVPSSANCEISCFNRNSKEETFCILFASHILKMSCNNGWQLGDVHFAIQKPKSVFHVEIDGCELSNKSFSSFAYTSIRSLKFSQGYNLKHVQQNLISKQIFFLEMLTLSNNKIETLDDNTFDAIPHLKVLDLSYNSLQTLPSQIFSRLQNITKICLENNYLSYLPGDLFKGLFQLVTLELSENKLKRLHGEIFQNLKSLTFLHMIRNELEELQENLFSHTPEIQVLAFSRNQLKSLPEKLFQNSTKLTDLDISSNLFIFLPQNLLKKQNNLRYLHLNECNLTSVADEFFQNAPNLLHVSMYNNRLKMLTKKLFQGNGVLEMLDLSYNDVADLIDSPFVNNNNLKWLVLYKNNLSKLSKENFVGLTSLKELDVSANFLSYIEENAFDVLQNLKKINISNNALSTLLGSMPFGLSEKIKNIDISNNNLTDFPEIENYYSLKKLRAQYNKIRSLTVPTLLSRKTSIFLQSNRIGMVNVTNLIVSEERIQPANFESNIHFHLQDNPFLCDCNLFSFYKYITGSNSLPHSVTFHANDLLMCSNPLNLKGKIIKTLPKESFTCDTTQNCPQTCHCSLRIFNNGAVANCSGKQLRNIPSTVPQNTQILHMENNLLTDLNELEREHWENLTELYVDNNFLVSENASTWWVPKNLQIFSLKNNQLIQLPQSIKNYADKTETFQMNLGNNSWICDCSATEFKAWLSAHSKQVRDIGEILCSKPKADNGTEFMQLLKTQDSILCPSNAWSHSKQLILYVTICGTVAIIIIALLIFYYRNKRTILAYIYIHLQFLFVCFYHRSDLDEDKMFDAFISYSSADRDVVLEILNEIENKSPHYRLCIHERDWIPGNFITDNILNSVQNSKKTILILSKTFLQSVWFDIEFHTAYCQMLVDKIDRLIVIIKGELPPRNSLDKDLQYLLSTKTYLVWEEKWFWEKLKYTMPHKTNKHRFCNWNIFKTKKKPKKSIRLEDKISLVSNEHTLSSNNNNTSVAKGLDQSGPTMCEQAVYGTPA